MIYAPPLSCGVPGVLGGCVWSLRVDRAGAGPSPLPPRPQTSRFCAWGCWRANCSPSSAAFAASGLCEWAARGRGKVRAGSFGSRRFFVLPGLHQSGPSLAAFVGPHRTLVLSLATDLSARTNLRNSTSPEAPPLLGCLGPVLWALV